VNIKSYLRKSLREQRRLLTSSQVENYSARMTEALKKQIDWKKIKRIHIYLPIENEKEVSTYPLISFLIEKHPNLEIYVPKSENFSIIKKDTELIVNNFGIPEPEMDNGSKVNEFDLAVVPVIGFDRRGYRIGYGRGYYDKFLSKYSYRQAIGLAYSFQEADEIPSEKHDQRLDVIITEKEIIKT
jgi:5-formyltetrahydrofolate cyclo-ligase